MPLPVKNVAFTFSLSLVDSANRPAFKASPTLAAGDFKVSIDGGAFNNLASLPTVAPASGRNVEVALSQSEMNGDRIVVQCVDAAGAEWDDVMVAISTIDPTVASIGADVIKISGDATAADNLETMLDGTGGQTLTLGQLRINSSSANGAIDIDNSGGAAIDARNSGGSSAAVLVDGVGAGVSVISRGSGTALSLAPQGTGIGLGISGGATSGNAVHITTISGHGVNIAPVGTDKHGIFVTGGNGGTSDGIKAVAGTGGVPIRGDITGNITGNLSGSVGNVTGSVGSVTGNVGGNVTGTIGGLTAAALADFFDTDSGTTYAAAVAGSVVKEIVSNAGGGGITAADVWAYATRTLTALDEDSTTLDLDATIRAAVGLAAANLDTQLDALPTAAENAAALLKYDMSGVSGESARSVLNSLRKLMNKWSISGTTLTVYKEDDSTAAYTQTLTATAGADPITAVDTD